MSNCDQFRDLIEPYALGALDAKERAAFEAHLATGCADCAKAVEEARWVVIQLAYMAPEATPSDMLKGRLMQTVRAETQPSRTTKTLKPIVPVWLWIGVAALFLFSVYSFLETQALHREIEQAKLRSDEIMKERTEAEQQLSDLKQQAIVLASPASLRILMAARVPGTPQLEARWHSQLGLVVVGQNVSVPSDRVLQLWLIPRTPGGKPVPSSTLRPDADGKFALLVSHPPGLIADTKALAITEEPPGGSLQPTSPIRWSGDVT